MNNDKYFSLDEYKRQKEAEANLARLHMQRGISTKIAWLGVLAVVVLGCLIFIMFSIYQ